MKRKGAPAAAAEWPNQINLKRDYIAMNGGPGARGPLTPCADIKIHAWPRAVGLSSRRPPISRRERDLASASARGEKSFYKGESSKRMGLMFSFFFLLTAVFLKMTFSFFHLLYWERAFHKKLNLHFISCALTNAMWTMDWRWRAIYANIQ